MNRLRRHHRPEFLGKVLTSTTGLSPRERIVLFEAKLKRAVPESSLASRAGRVVLNSLLAALFLFSLVGLVFVAGIFIQELMK